MMMSAEVRHVLAWLAMGSAAVGAQDPGLVYLPPVTGTVREGRPQTTIETQTAAALAHLDTLLATRGLTRAQVVVVNVVLSDPRHFAAMNEVYRAHFTGEPPTRATFRADLPDPDALVQLTAVAARGARRVIAPPGLRSPALPYSWGIAVGDVLFIAGATSRAPSTYEPVTGDVAVQTRQIFGNIALVLQEAGMGLGDLVSCRVWLEDAGHFTAMSEAYGEFVPAEDPPARATVRAGLMNPAFGVEIQCIADAAADRAVVIGEGRRRSRAPLSPAIVAGPRLYLSGMVGGSGDASAQTRATLENLRATLAAAGMDFSHVVETWVYVTDIRDWETVRGVMRDVLAGVGPEPTVVGAPLMGSTLLVEIQMVAER